MEITPELLRQYYLGLCNTEQQAAVKAWLEAYHVEEPPDYVGHQEAEQLRARIWQHVQSLQRPGSRSVMITNKRWWMPAVAASLIFACCFWYQFGAPRRKNQPTISYQTIASAPGERKQFTLTDGTIVYLNSGSELRFPARFADSVRSVSLSGEAFFKVAKNPDKPFIIDAGETQVKVLGTAFNLKSYSGESTVVTVQEGKVRFKARHAKAQMILTAGHAARYEEGKNSLDSANVYQNRYFSWKESKLIFSATPLSEMKAVLERWYGIRIIFKSPQVAERRFSGTYDNPRLDVLLKEMSMLMKFEYKFSGKTLVIE